MKKITLDYLKQLFLEKQLSDDEKVYNVITKNFDKKLFNAAKKGQLSYTVMCASVSAMAKKHSLIDNDLMFTNDFCQNWHKTIFEQDIEDYLTGVFGKLYYFCKAKGLNPQIKFNYDTYEHETSMILMVEWVVETENGFE